MNFGGLMGFGEFSPRLFQQQRHVGFCFSEVFSSCLCSDQGKEMRASGVLL